jgi:hypothetical protein
MESFQFIAMQSAFTTKPCTEIGNEGLDKLWRLWGKTIKKEGKKEQRKERKRENNCNIKNKTAETCVRCQWTRARCQWTHHSFNAT